MGVDLLYNRNDGMKIWLSYCSVNADQYPIIVSFFNDLQTVPQRLEIEDASVDDIIIHPGRSFFNHDNCVFKVVEVGDEFAIAQAIQSKSVNYVRKQSYRFNNLNTIKVSIKAMLSNN